MNDSPDHDGADGREPRQRKFSAPPKKGVEDYRNGAFFVREKRVEPATGEVYWLISPLAENEREQLIKVKAINDPSVDKSGIIKALDQQMLDVVPKISMVKRTGSDFWEAYHAEPAPPEKDRTIERDHPDENGNKRRQKAFTWTEDLDNQVERLHEYKSVEIGLERVQVMLRCDATDVNDYRSRHAEIMRQEVSRLISPHHTIPIDELEGYISDQHQGQSANPRPDMVSAMACQEKYDGSPEDGRGRHYSPEVSIENQLPEGLDASALFADPAKREQALAMLSNYCAQKAVFQMLTASIGKFVEHDGKLMTHTEAREEQMVKDQQLFASNPLMNDEKRKGEAAELAQMAASQIVSGMACAGGAIPHRKEYDQVRMEETTLDASGKPVPATLMGQVMAVALQDFEAQSLSLNDTHAASLAARIEILLATANHKVDVAAATIVHGEHGIIFQQVKNGAIHPPFKLKPPLISPDREKKIHDWTEKISGAASKAATHMTTEMTAPIHFSG